MSDDTYYITTHEAALAVVATAMKKSRLRFPTLILTSILGGMLFSGGGMIYFLVQADFQNIYQDNPGVVHLLQGFAYPLGLFYVVIMGTDLYNSNILFFTVGFARGAVSIFDLLISWSISLIFNLVGSIFVVYILCYLSSTTTDSNWQQASKQLLDTKLGFNFLENFLKGIPCNFLVALAIYLQLMTKPLHVKFMMMFLPVFTFVSMGFNHVVADMFIIPLALLNCHDWSVGQYIWRSLIPSALGNAVGGAAFAIMIPWYLHLHVVELDKKNLNLPEYDERDEQPEQGMDSRVVRVPSRVPAEELEEEEEESSSRTSDEKDHSNNEEDADAVSLDNYRPMVYDPIHPVRSRQTSIKSTSAISRYRSNASMMRLRPTKTRNSAEWIRSPKGVFPVYGMGQPYATERKISDPYDDRHNNATGEEGEDDFINNTYNPEESKMSENLRRIISRKSSTATTTNNHKNNNNRDIESQLPPNSHQPTRTFSRYAFSVASSNSNNEYNNISRRASRAGLTKNSISMSDDVAGIHPRSLNATHYNNMNMNMKDAKNAIKRLPKTLHNNTTTNTSSRHSSAGNRTNTNTTTTTSNANANTTTPSKGVEEVGEEQPATTNNAVTAATTTSDDVHDEIDSIDSSSGNGDDDDKDSSKSSGIDPKSSNGAGAASSA